MFKHILHFAGFIFAFFFNCNEPNIQIHNLGHSAFVIQFDDINVVTVYGKPNAWKEWGWDSQIHDIGNLVPDIMTYSHLHEDHYDSTRIPSGVKYILKNGEELENDGLKITAIPTCEDTFGEFNNTSYLFNYKGYNILHTGDIQGMIANIDNDSIADYFKANYPHNIDLLIMPIEGKIKFIPQSEKFIRLIKPKRVIPAHYWSQEYLDEFLAYLKEKNYSGAKYSIKDKAASQFRLTQCTEPDSTTVILLNRFDYCL
ncbi:MAG: MBL fold metallo-hydrolase [Bacteroidales bacterium]|nr:MBL fold metallo-hydrolase [Bacteroidales bacterium]